MVPASNFDAPAPKTRAHTGSEQDNGASLHAASLNEELSGWITLLKDLLKKARIALEEAKLMLGSIAFLRAYRRGGAGGSPESVFQGLYWMLAQQVAQLRNLHEMVRDDLVTIELLLLGDHSYIELSDVLRADQRFAVVLRRPSSANEGPAERYEFALRVLWSTSYREASRALLERLRRLRRAVTTDDAHAADPLLASLDAVPISRGEISKLIDLALESDDRGNSSTPPARRLEIIKALLLLQEQPYCQHERIDRWRSGRTATDEELHEQIRTWMKLTEDDGRRSEVRDQIVACLPGAALPEDPVATRWREIVDAFLAPDEHSDGWRRALLDVVVAIADECWDYRMARILRCVARLKQGDALGAAAPLHEHFLRAAARYHRDFVGAFSSLRAIIQSIQQRSAILPPGFPQVPRHHRREREAVEASLIQILSRMHENTAHTVGLLRRGAAASQPALSLEISFDYSFTSEVREFSPSNGVKAVMVVVPFFALELPRYMADVVHEIAHAYVTNDDVSRILSDDLGGWLDARDTWDRRVAEILRYTGGQLDRCYTRSGVGFGDEIGLISEVLADFVALLQVGPYYLFTLLFATIGLADLPNTPGEEPVEFINPPAISPMVRIGALLRVTALLWGRGTDDDVAFYRSPRIAPVETIWKAYFRVLEAAGQRGNWREKRRCSVFMEEINILGDALCEIVVHLQRQGVDFTFQKATAGKSAEHAKRAGEHIKTVLADIPFTWSDASPQAIPRSYLVVSAPLGKQPSPDQAWTLDNVIHLLWSTVLDRYREAARWFIRSTEPDPSPAARRFYLERALWLRTPEVRLMLGLMDPDRFVSARPYLERNAASPTSSPDAEIPSGPVPTSRRYETLPPPSPDGRIGKGHVVRIIQVDAFWWGVDSIDKTWERLKESAGRMLNARTYWVLGSHDFQIVRPRYGGVEDLRDPLPSMRSYLPERPRHCHLRGIDYIAIGAPPNQPGRKTRLAEAFFQIRLGGTLVTTNDFLALVYDEEMKQRGVERSEYVLQSFAWDHYGLMISFDTFEDLATWWRAVREVLAMKGTTVEYHTMSVLIQGPPPAALSNRVFGVSRTARSKLAVAYVTRFRCQPPAEGGVPADLALDPLQRARQPLATKLEELGLRESLEAPVQVSIGSTTGYDNLELRIEFWAEQYFAREQCQESLRVYGTLIEVVARETRAFDVQTSVVLPGC